MFRPYTLEEIRAAGSARIRLLLEFDPQSLVFGVGTNCNAYPVLVGLLEVAREEVNKMVNKQPLPAVQG